MSLPDTVKFSDLAPLVAPHYDATEALFTRWENRQLIANRGNLVECTITSECGQREQQIRADIAAQEAGFRAGRITYPRAFVVDLLPEAEHFEAIVADDRPIRSISDAKAWLGDLWSDRTYQTVNGVFFARRGGYWALAAGNQWPAMLSQLEAGTGNFKRGDALMAIAGAIGNAAEVNRWVDHATLSKQLLEVYSPPTFQDANLAYAGELLSEAPQKFVDALAIQYGVNRSDPNNARGAVAFKVALTATALGRLVPEIIDEYQKAGTVTSEKHGTIDARALIERETGNAPPVAVQGAAGNFFADFASGFKKLASHPGDWFRRVFVTEPGKALRNIGREILRLRNNAPWLGQFFLDPFAITAQAVFLQELGNAAIDGSISTFNEARFGSAAGKTFVAAGKALAVAAPFLPVPFNVAAAALAAASIALGSFIKEAIGRQAKATDLERQQAKQEKAAEEAEKLAQEVREQAEAIKAAEEAESITTAELEPEAPIHQMNTKRVLIYAGTAAASVVAVVAAVIAWR